MARMNILFEDQKDVSYALQRLKMALIFSTEMVSMALLMVTITYDNKKIGHFVVVMMIGRIRYYNCCRIRSNIIVSNIMLV
jgi:hypothetical protein